PFEELDLGDVVERAPPRERGPDHERVEEAAGVGRDDQRPLHPAVFAADPREPEVDEEEGNQDQTDEEIERAIDAVLTREAVIGEQPLLVHAKTETPAQRPVTGAAERPPRSSPGGIEDRREVRAADLTRRHPGELGTRHRPVENVVEAAAIGPQLPEGSGPAGPR